MTPLQRLTIFIVTILSLTACTGGDKATIAMLDRAEAYLPQHPDSAALLLDSIDTSCRASSSPIHKGQLRNRSNREAKRGKETGEWFPLYSLLRTMTDDMLHGITPNDSIIRHTYIYYKEQMDGKLLFLQSNTLKRRYARSAFYLARCLEQSDSIKAAEDLYRESSEYSRQAGDLHTCYNALYSLGHSVSYSNINHGNSILKDALLTYDKCNDQPINKVIILRELCHNKVVCADYDSAMIYARMAYDISVRHNLQVGISESLRAMSVTSLYKGEYRKALDFARKSVPEKSSATPFMLYNLANCYFYCDSIPQSKQLYDALRNDSDDYIRYVSYDMLSKIALRENNTQQAGEYFDSAKQVLESMYYKTQQLKAGYYDDIVVKELQNEKLKLQNQKQVLVSIIIILALALLAVILYRVALKKIALISEQRRISQLSYDKAVKQIQLLEQDINNQNLHISDLEEEYDKLICQTKQECEQYKQQYESLLSQSRRNTDKSSETLESLNERLKKSKNDLANLQSIYNKEKKQYRQHLLETIRTLNRVRNYTISQSAIYKQILSDGLSIATMTQSHWESLEQVINTCSDNFAARLKHQYPQLSDDCYHICMLNRIGFSRIQIASFMCIAEVTIKKKHQEYKAKLFSNTNPNDNFCDLIAEF